MALIVKDRVLETTTSTGTGTITLGGAVSSYQSFSVIGDGNTTYYSIVGDNEWEVGIGTYTASGTTLSRDTVLESSNSGSLVNFSAGTKQVFVTYPAEKSVDIDSAQTLTNKTISGSSNTLSNIGNSSLTNSSITINGTPVSLGGSASVGTVTSVSGTSPIASSGGNTPAISISQSNTTTDGYLSSTDWNTFNNKQAALVSGTNIKTVNSNSLLGSGNVSVGTVTSVGVTAGTGISVSGSPVTSSGSITVTNTAPDQTVALTAGTGISVSGTYPNFTITNTSSSSGTVTSVAAGLGMNFSTITGSGFVSLGSPSNISNTSTNSVSGNTHTHALSGELVETTTGSALYYGARAWVNFDGRTSGTTTIRASVNVSSIGDNAVGDYTVNFTTAMSDNNYAAIGMTSQATGDTQARGKFLEVLIPTGYSTDVTSSSVRVKSTIESASFNQGQDTLMNSVAIFR